MIEFYTIILRITINYMTSYIISYEDTFIVLQSLLLSILLLTAFGEILFYIPYDIMIWYGHRL
jgi:hypothetical protein